MKAIKVEKFGGPDVLKVEEVQKPTPGPGEVLVKIKAIGVNYMDVYAREGKYGREAPLIPGGEAAGVVEQVGEGVADPNVGDRVAYTGGIGSYAEYALVKADRIVKIPENVTFEEAAAVMLQGMTAHYLAHDFYPIQHGTTVLIQAVAGGVGLLLTQIVKHMGARVFGTTSTSDKEAIAKLAGADEVILYTKTNFAQEVQKLTNGAGVDVIFDGVGKTTFPGDLEAVRIKGTIVVFGMASGPVDPIQIHSLQQKSLTLATGSLPQFVATKEELQRRAGAIFDAMREGWLHIRIDHEYPLEAAAEAHRELESRHTSGKVLLMP